MRALADPAVRRGIIRGFGTTLLEVMPGRYLDALAALVIEHNKKEAIRKTNYRHRVARAKRKAAK